MYTLYASARERDGEEGGGWQREVEKWNRVNSCHVAVMIPMHGRMHAHANDRTQSCKRAWLLPYRGDTRQSIVTVGCGCNRYQHKPKHPPSQSQPNHTVEYRTLTFVPPPHPATSRHLHMGVRVIAMQMRGCRAYVQATQVSQRGAQIHAQAKKRHSVVRMPRAHRHLPTTRFITTIRFECARYCGQNVGGKSQAWVTMVQPSTHTT